MLDNSIIQQRSPKFVYDQSYIVCLYTVDVALGPVALGPYDWLASRILPKRYRIGQSNIFYLTASSRVNNFAHAVMVKRAFMYVA